MMYDLKEVESSVNQFDKMKFIDTDGKEKNACDKALYHMSTKEIKDQYGKTNRPKAIFTGLDIYAFENAAKTASSIAINNKHPESLEESIDISSKVHANMRDYIINNTYMKPKNLITGEDVKKVETRYKKLTKEQLAAIEEEF